MQQMLVTELKENRFFGFAENNKVQNSLIRSAINYIHDNYMSDLSLDAVADYLGINKYYLSHLFRQEMDTSFINYLTKIRIETVINLIAKRNYSISELACLTGYNDEAYLCKVMKKQTGMTIRELKQLYCKER